MGGGSLFLSSESWDRILVVRLGRASHILKFIYLLPTYLFILLLPKLSITVLAISQLIAEH